MDTEHRQDGTTHRRLVVLAGGEQPSGSRVPTSEFHRRWLELVAHDAPSVELVRLAFDYCHRMVYAVACRITGSRWEAEDVTQSVFEAFTRSLDRIRDPGRIPGFLKVSAVRNAMHRAKRGRWRRERLHERFEHAPVARSREEVALAVRELIDRLSVEDRTLLVLKFGEQMGYAEVADAMEMSVGTVRRRLTRAKARLEKMLGPGELDELLMAMGRE